jgi:hypothetical protein
MLTNPLHEHLISRYRIEIINENYQNREETAMIHFFDGNDKVVFTMRYAVLKKENLYNRISAGETLDLSHHYIKDFSLNDYRKSKGLDKSALVVLNNFNAQNAFFDGDLDIDFSFAQFNGDRVDFEESIFGNGNVDFFSANFNHCDVNFKRAKFGHGTTSFKSVRFGDSSVCFSNTNFGTGNLSFVDADFSSGNVDFKNTIFGDGYVDFKFARFSSGDISFEKANFGKGKKDFKNVEFGGGKLDFRRANFNDGDVSFEGVEFGNGKVSFRSSEFGHGKKTFYLSDFAQGEAQFDLVDFGTGEVSFNRARVADISFSGCHLDCYVDLRVSECRKIDLSNTIVRDILDIKPEDDRVIIKELNLVGMRILGRIFIDWRMNGVFDLINNQKETTWFQKAEQFRVLKENFRNNGQYEDEDQAYVEFKRAEAIARYHHDIHIKKKSRLLTGASFYLQKYIFDFVGKYGTDPIRVLFNVVIIILVYGGIYFLTSNFAPGAGTVATTLPEELNSATEILNCLYYSAITFFTVGYGDYFAHGIVKLIAVAEGFSGVFMMSYFTVAFVRKILR